MGNHVSHGSTRVMLPNGTVIEYNEPVMVAELMLDRLQQVAIEFRRVDKKPKPLAADFRLEKKKVYLMVPKMSLEEAWRILLRAETGLKYGLFMSAYTGFVPVFVKMWPGLLIKSKNKEKMTVKSPAVMMKSGLFMEVELVPEGRDGYYVKRSWKPSLDTIKEKGVKDNMRHLLC